ncbi:hypothetical protein LPJ61_000567 [Coemansia biformis]|uniref:HSF-type DNA-binding domain-containing protein n=1 Tax=Coemansia biformis TaxID=1286918 RepID=A0A9W8D0Y0_9FUNG|nr:hypothetical protein LPJ61_000567 [Coemansia biformis]
MNINTSDGGSSLQQLHETLANTGFGPVRPMPLSPDITSANALDPGRQLLVDASDQYLKPIARSTTPSSMESRRSSVSSGGSKLGNTFVSKLHEMVNDNQYQHLISWNFSGSSFIVCNIMEFSRELLPKHFKHNNFSSFVRQLNMYGFHKFNKSPRGHRTMAENQIWEFSHPHFIRDRPDLLEQIKRKTMESESLRRETGDLNANFIMLQVSHTDLVKRVHHLQENLSEVIRELAETRKKQATQESIIRQLLQALKQSSGNSSGGGIGISSELDIEAALATQSTRPSIFISDHDASSLLHSELGYSASLSALGSQLQLSSGSLIGSVTASPAPASPISSIGQIGAAIHHSASNQSLTFGSGHQQGHLHHPHLQHHHHQQQQQQQQHAHHHHPRQPLHTSLGGGDSLSVYGRSVGSSAGAGQSSPSVLTGISQPPLYSMGANSSLSNSSLSSNEKDVYKR